MSGESRTLWRFTEREDFTLTNTTVPESCGHFLVRKVLEEQLKLDAENHNKWANNRHEKRAGISSTTTAVKWYIPRLHNGTGRFLRVCVCLRETPSFFLPPINKPHLLCRLETSGLEEMASVCVCMCVRAPLWNTHSWFSFFLHKYRRHRIVCDCSEKQRFVPLYLLHQHWRLV